MVYVVGIAGASGSGKTTLATGLAAELGDATLLFLDRYYRDQSHIPKSEREKKNYDRPEALDLRFARAQIDAIRKERPVAAPKYNFEEHTMQGVEMIRPSRTLIVDGIFALRPEFEGAYDLSIFLDTPIEECRIRRIARDVKERGRSVKDVKKQLAETVIPGYEAYVLPTKSTADEVFEWNGDMSKKVKGLAERIRQGLRL